MSGFSGWYKERLVLDKKRRQNLACVFEKIFSRNKVDYRQMEKFENKRIPDMKRRSQTIENYGARNPLY
ncbi:hypothetical protein BBI11_09560 [Planococcus maritimus]|nr:hypothetical protein BBI11_09560 [Planococcus maritimus]